MKFGVVAKHRATWPVGLLCEALGLSRSGFSAWMRRPMSARAQRDVVLSPVVRTSCVLSAQTYGVRRVQRDVLAAGMCAASITLLG